MPPYTSEYQDRGFESLEHKIISYEMLMTYPYNLLCPTQPVTMDHIDYTCNSVILLLSSSPKSWVIPLWIILMRSERLTLTFLPKASPLGDIAYWSSAPSGNTLYIETGIYWLLALELPFCAWPMVAWFPLVPGSLTYILSVLLGTLSLTTTSSSEDWGPWTDGYYDPLKPPKIWSLAFLKRVNCS